MSSQPPLDILFAGVSCPPETFIVRLIKGLDEAGHRVTVASEAKPSDDLLSCQGLSWLRTPFCNDSVLKRLIAMFGLTCRALVRSPKDARLFGSLALREPRRKHLETWYKLLPFAGRRWDVIYFPWNSAAVIYQPLFDLGCPVVISCRGSQINVALHDPSRREFREGVKRTFQNAAAVHCVSEAIRDEARPYGLDVSKAWTIPPAVDPSFFRPSGSCGTNSKELRIVTIGGLDWRKGHEYALSSVRQLLDRGVPLRFDIIGVGPERQRVLYTISDLNLQSHVRLHGRLSPDKVRDILSSSDVFLLSSLTEGISNAALEAMACGLPIVTTDCGGMKEAITNGQEGFVVPSRDPGKMADALAKLACSPGMRHRMGQQGRKAIEEKFNIASQVSRFVELFRKAKEGSMTALSAGMAP